MREVKTDRIGVERKKREKRGKEERGGYVERKRRKTKG